MAYHIFDDPTLLIVIAVILEMLLLVASVFVPQRRRKLMLLIGPGLVTLVLALDYLVQTNREGLVSVTHELLDAVEREDAPAVMERVSPDARFRNRLDKAAVGAVINGLLQRPFVKAINVVRLNVEEPEDAGGSVRLRVRAILDSQGVYGEEFPVTTEWRLEFVRDGDGLYRLADAILLDPSNIDPFRPSSW